MPFSTGRAWDAPLSQSIDSDPPSLYGVKVWLKFLRRGDSRTSSSYLCVFRGGILFGVILWFSGPNGCTLSSEQIPKLLVHGSVFRGFRELNRSGLPQVCVNNLRAAASQEGVLFNHAIRQIDRHIVR